MKRPPPELLQRLTAMGARVGPAAPPDPRCSEGEFQARVVAEAKLLGWDVYHNPDSRRSSAGWPDLELVHPDRGYFKAELKKHDGRVRPDQVRVIDLLRRAGVRVFVWRPADWPEILKVLNQGAS